MTCSSLCQGVIGAGAAGLVAARELAREGHQPTVWEQGRRPGGVWVYSDAVEEAAMPGATFWPLTGHAAFPSQQGSTEHQDACSMVQRPGLSQESGPVACRATAPVSCNAPYLL